MSTILICLMAAGFGMLLLFGLCVGAALALAEEDRDAEELAALAELRGTHEN